MLPKGFLGTRADFYMDMSIVLFASLPFLILVALRLARRRKFVSHRNMQVATLTLVLIALGFFELDIRLSGGASALLAHSSIPMSFTRRFLDVHIMIASVTALAWIGLVVTSWARFTRSLPGRFAPRHVWWGKATFVCICLTSGTGAAVYLITFVA